MRILHIAAHLGGGVGKAISGAALQSGRDFGDQNRVLLLQEPEKAGYVQACRDNGVPVEVWKGGALGEADVIVVSWWNHPAMARFLREFPPRSAPLVLWSHVNGCHYPYLPFQLAEAFDEVLVTAPCTLDNPAWTEEERQVIRSRGEVVYGMGQFDPRQIEAKTDCASGGDFVVGYVGTLNYGKLHPEFTAFCREVCSRIPNARFVMAGDRDEKLERDVREAGLWDRFQFPGFVSDVPALMRTFDVFGYLLNPEHYGTTENVLLEAMACGLPCVVLRQNVERQIVPPQEEFAVETPAQYGERLAFLCRSPERRRELGRLSREHVLSRCGAKENTARFHAACARAAEGRRPRRDFSFLGDTPWQWFAYCLDAENRRRFEQALREPAALAKERIRACPSILRERRKSSLRHFASVYPEDGTLRLFNQWMEENEYGRHETEL